MKRTVIIGGVAGGASCAARLRRLDEERSIVLLERGSYISYANCGLPYFVGDTIKARDSLLVSTPEIMRARFSVDVRTESEAVSIDRAAKTVRVLDRRTGKTYDEPYDDLVISTGSSPIRPKIPGIESELVKTLWTVPDADNIRRIARESGIRSAAVVGAGFIGLEVAENFKDDGLDVSVIEGAEHVMPPVDLEMAKVIQENMIENGVHLFLNDPVESFEEIGEGMSRQVRIRMKSGKAVDAGLVVLSIGIRRNSKLAEDAGLEMGERGAVIVDEHMRTSDPSIYAVGDITQVTDLVTGGPAGYQLAGPANKQGRIAADNIAGKDSVYRGTQGTSIAKIFDLAVAMTGQNEASLARAGLKKGVDYEVAYVTQNQHAGFYPGAVPMIIKLLFKPDGSGILGAQIVGRDGVDKRIDTISEAIRFNARATDLAELELAYAPPFSSAKDPVNMIGFTVKNMTDGLVRFCSWDEIDKGRDLQLIDVREDAERLAFEVPGAAAVPLGQLRDKLGEFDPDKATVLFCSIGVRSYNAARILSQHGFKDVSVYPGGTRFYQSTHYDKFAQDAGVNGTACRAGGPSSEARQTKGETGQGESAAASSGSDSTKKMRIDCSGMQCPGPLLKVFETMKELKDGEMLEVTASDPGFTKDIAAWCRRTGNELLSNERRGSEYVACIMKGNSGMTCDIPAGKAVVTAPAQQPGDRDGKTLIVFSGDMDRVLASFIIANGAAAMGKPVTMFFTFWGLSVLRKPQKQHVSKTFTEKMFGAMLPRGTEKLKLSKMNMGGMGTAMMRSIMKEKHVDSLEELVQKAIKAGVKIVACSMSMDVMGIKPEELIDGVEIGGVGYYLGDAEESNVNLFI